MSNVSVPVMADDIDERNETFAISLSLSSSVNRRITLGDRTTVTVTITDSTSKHLNCCMVATAALNVNFFTVIASIITDPISIIVFEKTMATLSCNATASGPIRYQWRTVNGEISSDRAEGVNTPTLTISPVQQEDEDEYYCVASYGVVNGMDHSDESKRAKITVLGM